MSQKILILVAIVLVIVGLSVWATWESSEVTPEPVPEAPVYVEDTTPTPTEEEPVACTADAMQCPDGSYVGRIAPSCEFAECPTPVEMEDPVICTADAKQCPDGSYVGRVAPSCEFAQCPVSPSATMELQMAN